MIFPLVGNERIKDALTASIETHRIPHAIIIEGDKGQGKKTLARFIGKAAVCSGENRPCDNCANCHLADIASHPDITVVRALPGKKNIAVAQVRELRADVFIKPHQAQYRVCIIDGAETMNEQAQNALLKVLEEPPKSVVFILITESRSALLDTILSRCVSFSLTSPERAQAARYLSKTTQYSEQDIALALDDSAGNIGFALEILKGDKNTVKEKANQFLSACENLNEWEMLITVNSFDKDRLGAGQFTDELKRLLSERARQNANSPYLAKNYFSAYKAVQGLEGTLKTNINLSLYFTTMVYKLSEIFGGKN